MSGSRNLSSHVPLKAHWQRLENKCDANSASDAPLNKGAREFIKVYFLFIFIFFLPPSTDLVAATLQTQCLIIKS